MIVICSQHKSSRRVWRESPKDGPGLDRKRMRARRSPKMANVGETQDHRSNGFSELLFLGYLWVSWTPLASVFMTSSARGG